MKQVQKLIMLVTACAALMVPIRAAGQQAGDRAAALKTQVDLLRAEGKFAEALGVAKELLEVRQSDTSSKPFQIELARRLVSTLGFIINLPVTAQQDLAKAYGLTPKIQEHFRKAEYTEGVTAAETQLAVFRRVLGDDDLGVAISLNALGALLAEKGDYAGAELRYREALAISRKTFGNDHPSVASNLNNLGILLSDKGDYAGAEPFYREALAIQLKALGNDHPDVATSLINLGILLARRGDYAGAEPLYREALAIRRKALGNDHPNVAKSLNNLGNLLARRGDYAGAEPLYREALAIQLKALGNNHPDVAASLHNLGILLSNKEDYAGAEPFYREALAIQRTVLGNDHPDLAMTLNDLGVLLARRGDYAGAEPLYRETLAIQRKALGNDHPDVARSFNNLGNLLSSKGDYLEAEETLSRAAEAWEASRLRVGAGTERASFQQSPYPRLALVRLELGRTGEAWPAAERDLGRALADLLFAARARPLTRVESAKEDSLSSALANLESQVMALENARSTDAGKKTGADFESARDRLFATQSVWSAFETEIANKYPISEGRAYPLAKVQAVLDDRMAILGWLDVEMQGKDDTSSWVYVVRNTGPVVWARLEPSTGQSTGSSIERTRQYRERLALFTWSSRTTETILQTSREQWMERVAPVADALKGVTHLVVIPSGAMLGVPIEAMVDETGAFIGDRFSVSYAPSATIYTWLQERARERTTSSGDKSLLVGDPPFQQNHLAAMERQEDVKEVCLGLRESRADDAALRYVLSGNETARRSLQRLPCTRMEIEAIAPLVPEPTLLVGLRASEEEIARLATIGELKNFKVIHLATHAFMDDEQPERSALILSLVNLPDPLEAAMKGERIYDGLVTAKEIVREWELHADLVALSACNTGLGKVVGGEGYVGFAHAFLQAGAKSLIVSLWKVDDRATSLLMQRFYENWTGRSGDPRKGHTGQAMSKAEALQEAKHFVRTFTDSSGKQPFEHPCYWAAFILIGEQE